MENNKTQVPVQCTCVICGKQFIQYITEGEQANFSTALCEECRKANQGVQLIHD